MALGMPRAPGKAGSLPDAVSETSDIVVIEQRIDPADLREALRPQPPVGRQGEPIV
jgi:hypothetical protein